MDSWREVKFSLAKLCFPIFSYDQNNLFGRRGHDLLPPPKYAIRLPMSLPHSPTVPCLTKPANPLTRALAPYFPLSPLTSHWQPSPGCAGIPSLYSLSDSPLLHPARTHATHGLKTTGLRYYLEARFRRKHDSTKNIILILFLIVY